MYAEGMLRYGIMGFGGHGDRRLMPGFALAQRSRAAAISRRTMEKARATAERYGIAHAYSSKEELCRSPEVDAILIATPNVEHCQDALLSLSCGKPVLCEKPMAMNAAEAARMVLAARQAGLPLGVAHVFRFEQSVERMRALVASGVLGPLVFARSEFSYWGVGHPRAWLLDRNISGGGPVADVGVHCLDALRYVTSKEILRLSALGHADRRSGQVEASAVLSLEFEDGCLGMVTASLRATYRTPFELVGEAGVLHATDGLSVEHPVEIVWQRTGEPATHETVDNADAYARQVDAFTATVEDGAPFAAPGEEGWRNQRLLDAAYLSLSQGAAIAIPRQEL